MSWLIASQIVQDNATGLRFEFDEGDNGATQTLRVFTKERTRVLVLMFQRDGGLIKSDVRGVRDGQLEDVGQAAFQELHQDPAVADAAARSSADLTAHQRAAPYGDTQGSGPVTADELESAAKIGEPVPGPNAGGVPGLIDPTARPGVEEEPVADEAPKQQGVFYGG